MIVCPGCNKQGNKVIAAGMPMKFCFHCHTLWGFWSNAYTYLVAPLEGMINGGFMFMSYTGSYWKALLFWLRRK